jgi:hypothetical protein
VNAFYQIAFLNWVKGRSTLLIEYKDLVWKVTNIAILRYFITQKS